MLETYARWLVQRPVAWAVVVATVFFGAVAGWLSLGVEQDDDVLAFLPRSNPDIVAFYEINEAFGSTDVALVGVAPRGGSVFDANFLGRLDQATQDLREVEGIDHVLSLSNVADFESNPSGGIVQGNLVPSPVEGTDLDALRTKVMSRAHVVGNLVSSDAGAVVIYAWLGPGATPRQVVPKIRETLEPKFDGDEVVWGGGPFISDWIFSTTQADMAALTPWSAVVILVIGLLAFRDLPATLLGLVATGLAIAGARALMVVTGTPFNVVLSSMPVILFATGSAYAIHMLSKYGGHAARLGAGPEAVVATLVGTTRNVVAAGLTTVAGLWSMLLMDIAPMRDFGLFTGIGVALALLLSLTFVPAVMALFPRPAAPSTHGWITRATAALAMAAREQRRPAILGILAVCVLGVGLVLKVDARMELSAFFGDDAPPARSERFLQDRFGGSQFLQVRVRGDLTQPGALREVARAADTFATLPHVSSVQGVHLPMELIHEAMVGSRRLPDQAPAAASLFKFLDSDPAVSRLVKDDRTEALLVLRLDSAKAEDLEASLDAVEAWVAHEATTSYTPIARTQDPAAFDAAFAGQLAARLRAAAERTGATLPGDLEARLTSFLAAPAAPADAERLREDLGRWLASPENLVEIAPDRLPAVRDAVVALPEDAADEAIAAAVAGALGELPASMRVQDLLFSLGSVRADFLRDARAAAATPGLMAVLGLPADHALAATVARKLTERDAPTMPVAGEGEGAQTLAWTVSGQPVLYRGLSRSVTANQFSSLGSSLVLVLIIMSVLLRSVWSGLLSVMPTVATIVVVYGAMGWMGVHLDIGTSMIASIIVGAGVDYAVHLLAAWEASPDEPITAAVRRAVEDTAHAIWTNAGMVGAGFVVLTLGDAKPLINVGALTSAAMVVAALATFAILPVFANKRRYNAETILPASSGDPR
jgi:predicted RND superfamily exporter protein